VPELLGPLGELIAETVREHEPEAVRLAGPSSAPSRWRPRPRFPPACRS